MKTGSSIRSTISAITVAVLAGAMALTSTAALANTAIISQDFESGLGAFEARHTQNDSTLNTAASADYAVSGTHSAAVTGRKGDGDGIRIAVHELLEAGKTYNFSAQLRYIDAGKVDPLVLSAEHTVSGSTNYSNLISFESVNSTSWTSVTGSFKMPAFDAATSAYIYIESKYQSNNTTSFYVDDFTVSALPTLPIQTELEPLKATMGNVNLGVAIDARETTGSAGQLVAKHFNQITAENHMKVEAWYDTNKVFGLHTEAKALMDFAAAQNMDYYGHVLTWHSQTPDWFFEDNSGVALTSSAADKQFMRNRLRTHIENVAKSLYDIYGPYGSATNPLVAWDVVNEVVSDGNENLDGLRRSKWFAILGEEYIDLSFEYAEEFFNGTYAQPGVERPVMLFINDYNTEQNGKQQRYEALVDRLIERDVPIDGVGHQFHVNTTTPINSLDTALNVFSAKKKADGSPLLQAVTEFDVTTGTPVTQAKLIEHGHYYKDAFEVFRSHARNMFSVTVWGLTDDRSWRVDDGAPLMFDESLQAKPAYFGAAGSSQLPEQIRTANAFRAPQDDAWGRLPQQAISPRESFELRWTTDQLVVHVVSEDNTTSPDDRVEVTVNGQSVVASGAELQRTAARSTGSAGYRTTVEVPLPGANLGQVVDVNVSVTNDSVTTRWAGTGTGSVTLVEEYSYRSVPEASESPIIDGVIGAAEWRNASEVETRKNQQEPLAKGRAKLLWRDQTLYVLAQVEDPSVDWTGSDPWIQDSIELYLDRGNAKHGSYRASDTQIRIGANGAISFGTGNEAAQLEAVDFAVTLTESGYFIELAVGLFDDFAGPGTLHGLDFQINDATAGARIGMSNWADATGMGYQSTARWGVIELEPKENSAPPTTEPPTTEPPTTEPPQTEPPANGSPNGPGGQVPADPGDTGAGAGAMPGNSVDVKGDVQDTSGSDGPGSNVPQSDNTGSLADTGTSAGYLLAIVMMLGVCGFALRRGAAKVRQH